MLNCRPKNYRVSYRVSKNLVFLGSCIHRYTRYTIHDVFVYRVPNSERYSTRTICILHLKLLNSHIKLAEMFCAPSSIRF